MDYANRMPLLEIEGLCFNYQDKELYKNASMRLNAGEHAVLYGINGAGKTTLLELIVGNLSPDKGKIVWESGVTYSYLDQQLKVRQDVSVIDYLYGVYGELFTKEKRMEELFERAATAGDEKAIEKACRLQEELLASNFYALQEKVGKLTDGLGFDASQLERSLGTLSSGQREKAYLAKMLLEEKDVLIMDEPTNFLDQTQVTFLAKYLQSYPNAFLVVTHDQNFAKSIANVVYSLENQTLTRYKGDFDRFLNQREIDREQYRKNYDAQQRYIKKEETFIAKHIVRATSAKAAKSHRTRLTHLSRLEAPQKEGGDVRFFFPSLPPIGKKTLEVNELVIGYERPLLEPISFTLQEGEKIAIIGQNGVGKTTFLKTILGRLPALGGEYIWLSGLKVNFYEQDDTLDKSLSAFETLQRAYPSLSKTDVRKRLGSFGVRQELAIRPLAELSGGEVTKTRFALLSLSPCNFLILDEPTNHLDQKAKDALFAALERFEGSLILVSHEKDFYDGLVDYELRF